MQLLKSIYSTRRFFIFLLLIVALFITGAWLSLLAAIAKALLMLFALLCIFDLLVLYGLRKGLKARREMPELFSNGDKNMISIHLVNRHNITLHLNILDEIPAVFQIRDFSLNTRIRANERKVLHYSLRPVKRGEFDFGALNVYATTVFGFIERRYRFDRPGRIKVYPSFQQIKNLEFFSIARMKNFLGTKKIRKPGHNREFEHIKDYIPGDEPRHINWKATARRNKLMVNDYQEEKSQNVYSFIDMGRGMEMAFGGMTLLDYAINASLALGRVVLKNGDRFGMLSYTNKVKRYIPAGSRNQQFSLLMEELYKQQNDFR